VRDRLARADWAAMHPQLAARSHSPHRIGVLALVGVLAVAAIVAVVATTSGGRQSLVAPTVSVRHPRSTEPPDVSARLGPGPATASARAHGYEVRVQLAPNRAGLANATSLQLRQRGRLVSGARVSLVVSMLDMDMGRQLMGRLAQTAPGTYARPEPALGMAGRWGMRFDVLPRKGAPFSITVVDRMRP
jgi:YtkA-like